jgi:hypothetical protein
MDVSHFYESATQLAKEAVKADEAKDYKKAFDCYCRSLDHFEAGLKCECGRGRCSGATKRPM